MYQSDLRVLKYSIMGEFNKKNYRYQSDLRVLKYVRDGKQAVVGTGINRTFGY